MISLTQFRQNLIPIFRVMMRTGMYVDVSYRGRAYRVTVEDIGKAPPRRRGGRKLMRVAMTDVAEDKCALCGRLTMAGVCMNSQCSNRLDDASASDEGSDD